MKERTSPRVGLSLVWSVALVLSVYGAPHARDEIARSDVPGKRWLGAGVSALSKLGDAIGIAHVRHGVERLRSVVNGPYLILVQPILVQPTDLIVARPTGERAPAGPTPAQPTAERASISPTPAQPTAERASISTVTAKPDVSAVSELPHRAAPVKRRVLVVGASSIQYALGVELERRLSTYEGVKVKRLGQLATTLSRPDLFDWRAQLDALSREFRPDLVIANFGGNCAQNIPVGDDEEIEFGTERWDRLYAERVQEFVAVARKHGADVVFAGMPNMRDPTFRAKMDRLNRAQRQGAEAAGALWISTWEMTSTTDGRYKDGARWLGRIGGMRTVDGIHFRTMGALYVIEEIMQVIERHFILSPPSRDLARAERHTFESRLAGRPISYVAFIPNDADRRNRRPVVYVVPGAAANWREWPNYPHRDLQRASQAHDVVLVVLDGEMTADLIATEVLKDVETHLPVSDRRGLVGPDLLDLHAALTRRQIPVTFKHVDGVAFRSSLENQIAWHADQLRSAGH